MCRSQRVTYRQSPPNHDFRTLKNAIPERCFNRSLIKSSLFVLSDLAIVSTLFYAATLISYLPWSLRFIAWPIYWFIQGAFMTGVWVLAHECGHQAFSKYGWINDIVGWVLHSALLVPYFSWKYTHAQHHSGTSDMSRDTVFLPPLRSEVGFTFDNLLHDAPIKRTIGCLIMLIFGWPTYLLFGVSGPRYTEHADHFNPSSPSFKPHQRAGVLMSDVGIALILCGLAYWISCTSLSTFVCYYFIPYLWTNAWLVTITFLQHTHPAVPHYKSAEWNFVRGALATVDRDYGILNYVFHHIGDTHVTHHMFSQIPHYNAVEATHHLKKALGDSYLYDDTPIVEAVYRTWDACRYVPNEGDVLYWAPSETLSHVRRA